MTKPNILFIMCDQLRWDYLSCYGHPHLHTPNIDRLAERGVRFNRAYVQAPICGPARASFYTGRYVSSHGSSINMTPLPVSERTLGEYLQPLGVRTAVSGKTHIVPNREGMARLGIDPASEKGRMLGQGGFEHYWHDNGIHSNDERSKNSVYNQYLRSLGYEGDNPWHTHANGAVDEDGNFRSGWFIENAHFPANIKEEHSETPYTVSRAIEFMEEAGDQPWCLHVSFIKPHWPVIAPAPYNDMYSAADVIPLNRTDAEREQGHPVFKAYMEHAPSKAFSVEGAQEKVIPPYMGLIKQVDDQIGRLMAWLEENGQLDNTFIVFTSDHGDYLGDHWLGDKDFFHEESVKVPLIVVDPRPKADATRGTVNERLIEAIDLVPTFIEVMGGTPAQRLEGRSLLPLLRNQDDIEWREFAISEVDFIDRKARSVLNHPPERCWTVMVVTDRWKYIVFDGFRPMLFDLHSDPKEQIDLGADPDSAEIRAEMHAHLTTWMLRREARTTRGSQDIARQQSDFWREKLGILIGYWAEDDLPEPVKEHRAKKSNEESEIPGL